MKRWLWGFFFALTLCVCVLPARAAVTSGGVEYLWDRADSGNVMISADGGLSYAELPGLAEEAARTGLAYDVALYPMEDGGIRVEARDCWSTQRAYQREYPATEVAQALTKAESTPLKVLCTNGQVTIAEGYASDRVNGDWTVPNQNGWADHKGQTRLFYSLDGVTWALAEVPEDAYVSGNTAWWDGTAFYTGISSLTSTDGIHWAAAAEELGTSPDLSLSTDLGKYHFEYDQGTGEVYLMDQTSADTGVLLPHMGQAIRGNMEEQIYLMENRRPGSIRAWYGPDDTVFLAVYPITGEESLALICYPISSLDWCLENLKTRFRTIEPMVSGGGMTLGMVEWSYRWGLHDWSESRMAYDDGTGWKWAENVPWGREAVPLCCEGGYLWVKGEGHHLYRSADGRTWLLSDAIRPSDQTTGNESYLTYKIVGTGNGFLASRHGGTYRHGMMGASGGGWCEGYSKVYLLDKNFNLVTSYDFGRLVETVGYLDGVYYAQVGNSTGNHSGFPDGKGYDESLGSTIYRSTDGKTWTALPDIYVTIDDVWQTPAKTKRKQRIAAGVDWGMRTSHLEIESTAVLDDWRFFLTNEGEVYLLRKDGAGWVNLPHLGQAARQRQVDPAFITAGYNSDGTVKVELTDRWTPAFKASIDYPVDSLDWVKENLGETWVTDCEAGKPGVADVIQRTIPTQEEWIIQTPFGEVDATDSVFPYSLLLYRSADTGGEYRCYENAPWGSTVQLLPFSGKDFMAIDVKAEKLFLSSDGVTWREAAGDWITGTGAPTWGSSTYSFVWTGQYYLACCMQSYSSRNGGGINEKHQGMVYFLDEELNLVSSTHLDVCDTPEYHSFHMVEQVGYRDGVCYAQTWADNVQGMAIFRSADGGKTWEATDIGQVRSVLR